MEETTNQICQDCIENMTVQKVFDYFKKYIDQKFLNFSYQIPANIEVEPNIFVCYNCYRIRNSTNDDFIQELEKETEDSIFQSIYRKIWNQPAFIEECEKQNRHFINSISTNYKDSMKGEK